MKSGKLKKRLVLQSKVEARDAFGGVTITWATESTVWGSLLPLKGSEIFSQEQLQAETKVRVVMRYYSGLDTTWRISYDSKFYDIVDVNNINKRDRTMVLMCRQGVSEDVGAGVGTSLYVVNGGVNVVNGGVQVVNTI